MKKIFSQKRYVILGTIGVMLLVGLGGWYLNSKNSPKNNFSKPAKTWQTISVKKSADFSAIKVPGQVKSNEFAIIAPRRSGIIQDLLVDIGDQVTKGQTIGSMLPAGVEGQSSAAIGEASARLQKVRAELDNAKGVAEDAISVANKQWVETDQQSQTQSTLDAESVKQLAAKKSEAVLVATQTWEDSKLVLFGSNANQSNRAILGTFSNSVLENTVKNLADDTQRMETSGEWATSDTIIEHLAHLENFLVQVESLYKSARTSGSFTETTIASNLDIIQTKQLNVSQIKQAILALEEKQQRFASQQAERAASSDRSKEVINLVQSQQDLSITQAEKNIEVALANYNAALVRSGHQTITSPFSGTISARMVEVGQAVTPNTNLFYLDDVATSRAEQTLSEVHFQLPESWQNQVALGDPVELKTLNGETFAGQIFRLSPQINLQTQSIMATAIVIPETEEKSADFFTHGQSVFVYLSDQNSSIFNVPTLALKKRQNQYFLWKKSAENIEQLSVQVVAEDGEFSQIFSRDLKVGDAVISNPSFSLFKK